MSSLAADPFGFTFPGDPATPPPPPQPAFYDPSALLNIPFHGSASSSSSSSYGRAAGHGHGHARSSSQCSAYSAYSFASASSFASSDAFLTTPAASPTPAPASLSAGGGVRARSPARSPIRTHGPLLLPKIRSQDQALDAEGAGPSSSSAAVTPRRRVRTSSPAAPGGAAAAASAAAAAAHRSRSLSAAAASRRRSLVVPVSSSSSSSATALAARHVRSFTNPDNSSLLGCLPPALLCEPAHLDSRRASTSSLDLDLDLDLGGLDGSGLDAKFDYDYGFAPYPGTVPGGAVAYDDAFYGARAPSPLSVGSESASGTPEPLAIPVAVPVITNTPPSATTATPPAPLPAALPAGPTTSLAAYLTAPNPAPALVRTLSFPLRDPSAKHCWWDVRQVRPWTAFTAANLAALPGAAAVLSCAVPAAVLPPVLSSSSLRLHPETEAELHALAAAHYLPRVNAALALSSPRPVQLASATEAETGRGIFVGATSADRAAALFGGGGGGGGGSGPAAARVVGLVQSFDRFNTGMRAEGNVKRVEYLRGLAHLHHLMRAHGCRYGFLLTEIELVVVRNGTAAPTPLFGQLEVATVQLAAASAGDEDATTEGGGPLPTQLTAALALWGLAMLASDEMAAAAAAAAAQPPQDLPAGAASLLCAHRAHIGAPAEGTRRKAAPRDAWMPPPQLAEKRAAKRARGWVLPEDPVGRKELGRRGVRYSGAH